MLPLTLRGLWLTLMPFVPLNFPPVLINLLLSWQLPLAVKNKGQRYEYPKVLLRF